MRVSELRAQLEGYDDDAILVFEDCTTPEQQEELEFEGFEVEANEDGEVVVRLI